VNKTGKLCIEVTAESKISHISEELCIGCGICVKKCPFDAITIINLPSNLDKDTTHRFGPNAFKLHRLPTPRPGQVLGLVGSNGTGKTTALRVLAGQLKPNLGRFSVRKTKICFVYDGLFGLDTTRLARNIEIFSWK
jgi:ATP-binding cassette subfamily E protein 1